MNYLDQLDPIKLGRLHEAYAAIMAIMEKIGKGPDADEIRTAVYCGVFVSYLQRLHGDNIPEQMVRNYLDKFGDNIMKIIATSNMAAALVESEGKTKQ